MAKRALCIGINNYPGTENDLAGCVNDARDWAAELDRRGFGGVRVMLDRQATKEGMVEQIRRLVTDSKAGDLAVLQYSGHGTWVPDEDGDEPDQRDEALCPWDIGSNRPLVDDELASVFAEADKGVRIVFISDSCHSGTVARFAPSFAGGGAHRARFLPPAHFLGPEQLSKAGVGGARAASSALRNSALLLAACQDVEFSYDAELDGRANGAFSYVALRALRAMPDGSTFRAWYAAIRKALPTREYPQRPNLVGTKVQKDWPLL